ncbi:MAG TPA: hypothetical protein VGT08_01885 [Terracidiphilus sp.]|nr:hypothetical protein [Terracidiphilus sp.]
MRLRPEGEGGGSFHLEAKPGDEESARLVEHIVALCNENGLDKVRGAYSYLVLPHYEAPDLASAPLLWLLGQKRMFKRMDADQRDDRGRLVLPATEAKPTIKLASIFPKPWIVISEATRRILEGGGLAGVKFDEVAIRGRSVHASPEPFWELSTGVILPKMVNSVADTTVDWDPPRHRVHDPYGEPHYRQSELQVVGAFDIAHTFERLTVGEPALIISQRFYQICLRNRIPLEAQPVRVDPV